VALELKSPAALLGIVWFSATTPAPVKDNVKKPQPRPQKSLLSDSNSYINVK
jgi:hypothetical protein